MYLSTVERPTSSSPTAVRISTNVLALGAVSLVTDISAEMVMAVLPAYLVLGLRVSPSAYGVVDGAYTGATALLRLVGGYVADRTRRRKAVAGLGYGLSALAKLGLLGVGAAPGAIGAVIAADRTGKGLRTAPRDALISLSTPREQLGRAFGVHRAMDSAGAFAGPLVALAVLAAVGGTATGAGYDALFVTSFCIAAFGVLILVLFVRDGRGPRPPAGAVDIPASLALLSRPEVRRLVVAAAILGLATVGDGFVYLALQQRTELTVRWFPLLAVGTSLVYLLLAAPLGALADRVGRLRVLLGGYLALLAVYLLLVSPLGGWLLVTTSLGLYGLFYAAADGVLMALAGPLLPQHLRTTGIALIQTGQALAYLVSSVVFGVAWQRYGIGVALGAAAIASVAALLLTALLLSPVSEEVA